MICTPYHYICSIDTQTSIRCVGTYILYSVYYEIFFNYILYVLKSTALRSSRTFKKLTYSHYNKYKAVNVRHIHYYITYRCICLLVKHTLKPNHNDMIFFFLILVNK